MSGTKTLQIDDKWSVEYEPKNNDRPVHWIRYGEDHSPFEENNATVAMFYSLLQRNSSLAELEAERAKVAKLVDASRNLAAWCNVTLYARHQDENLGSLLKAVDAAITEMKEATK